MTHGRQKRRTNRTDGPNRQSWFRCPDCGKRTYTSRRDAKRVCTRARDGGKPSAYECEPGSGRWHSGHLGQAVKLGVLTRHELYGAAA